MRFLLLKRRALWFRRVCPEPLVFGREDLVYDFAPQSGFEAGMWMRDDVRTQHPGPPNVFVNALIDLSNLESVSPFGVT